MNRILIILLVISLFTSCSDDAKYLPIDPHKTVRLDNPEGSVYGTHIYMECSGILDTKTGRVYWYCSYGNFDTFGVIDVVGKAQKK